MSLDILLEKAAVISREVAAKEALTADQHGTWVAQTMKALQESKLTGLVVPKAQGGLGYGPAGIGEGQ
jgi:alkylation response protein AidB-like acyl-CoA dehydrogenase